MNFIRFRKYIISIIKIVLNYFNRIKIIIQSEIQYPWHNNLENLRIFDLYCHFKIREITWKKLKYIIN